MKYYICLGDRTSSGGVVLEGTTQSTIKGRPIVSQGMKVQCCDDIQIVQQGWAGYLVLGQAVAYHGCALTCGCTLLSSQNLVGWSDCSQNIENNERYFNFLENYHEFFTIFDAQNKPLSHQKYCIYGFDQSVSYGYTNGSGQTKHIWIEKKQPVYLEILGNEQHSSQFISWCDKGLTYGTS